MYEKSYLISAITCSIKSLETRKYIYLLAESLCASVSTALNSVARTSYIVHFLFLSEYSLNFTFHRHRMLLAFGNKFINICEVDNDELHIFYSSQDTEIIQGG
jgi:hypothetical protein